MTAIQPHDVLGPKVPADDLALMRLRRVLDRHFGEIDLLDAHLGLMDARGVLYATSAAENWSHQTPATFFGLVRHVVRTQSDDEVPDPDAEGWLAAGRPEGHEVLDIAWDTLNITRYSNDPLPQAPRPAVVDPSIERFDQMLLDWPGGIGTFASAYCRLEWFIEARGVTLPALTH